MEILNTIFRLGVIFAIYGFIWAFIEMGLNLLRSGKPKTTFENYLIKGVKFSLLSIVAFLFTLNESSSVQFNSYFVSGLIVLFYFVGKLDKAQQRQVLVQFMSNQTVSATNNYNKWGEFLVILIAMLLYVTLYFFPEYAFNGISLWFKESILSIEKTPIFGWIFKLFGFFFLLSIFLKVINAFFLLISGKMLIQTRAGFRKKEENDEFDDYEELN